MIENHRRASARRMTFTELGLARLKAPKVGQQLYWDTGTKGQLGLSLLVSSGGTKTYRSTFYLHGDPISRKLGRVGEMDLGEARRLTQEDRKTAASGIDPREPKRLTTTRFEEAVDRFITEYAKPRQRTWDQTERVLKHNCATWLRKPLLAITKSDARELLRGFVADGHVYKAAVTRAWLKKFWRWAYEEDLVPQPMMEGVALHYDKRERARVFSDNEVKMTWRAADALSPTEGAYVKLLILLAPRKTALACLQRSHLDDVDSPTLWTTPFELTKSRKTTTNKKRVYLTPLPSLAQRVVKGVIKGHEDRLFPDLPVHQTRAGRPTFYGVALQRKLVEAGAPEDFDYHGWRHTIATWLENAGHSEWERGLALNHSGSGSVTAGYSHGYPLELKRELLTEWANHVEGLVRPEGVALLR